MITKIHHKKGKRFEFESHINEFLIPREKARASETFLVIIKPKRCTHSHKHPDMEQTFYVTRGRGTIFTKIKGKERKQCDIKLGDIVFIPLNNWHRIECTGTVNLEYVCFNAFPKGFLRGETTSVSHAVNVVNIQKKK